MNNQVVIGAVSAFLVAALGFLGTWLAKRGERTDKMADRTDKLTNRYFDDLDDAQEINGALRGDYWTVYGIHHQGASMWRRLWDELPKRCPTVIADLDGLGLSRADYPDMPAPQFLEVERRHAARDGRAGPAEKAT